MNTPYCALLNQSVFGLLLAAINPAGSNEAIVRIATISFLWFSDEILCIMPVLLFAIVILLFIFNIYRGVIRTK